MSIFSKFFKANAASTANTKETTSMTDARISPRFVCIDVEYADNKQSICQFGVVVVNNQQVIRRANWLIQPPGNHYEEKLMQYHHITPEMTRNAPNFAEVWPEIKPYLLDGELWAHNAASVEIPVIEKNLQEYGHIS